MAEPTFLSDIPPGTDTSAYDRGLELLGQGPTDQGRLLASVLESLDADGLPLYSTVGVLMPRRSTKTTALWATLLGRCASRPGYRVVTTAQDGTRAGNIMRERMRELEAQGFEDDEVGVLRWSNGRERIEFANGSVVWVVAPNASAFRSEAADAMLFDEAGELNPERSEDLLGGALPLLDTRPMGQAIVAGTPAKTRAGLLWTTLVEGRAAVGGDEEFAETGIVDFSVRDDESLVTVDDAGEVHLDEEVLRRVHPGIGTLTTMAKMRARFRKMQLSTFEREYGCIFPRGSTTSAIDPDKWAEAKVEPVERDGRVGIGFDCAYDGSSATIAYAWRDSDGLAYGEVVAHRSGTSWVARAARDASAKNDRVPIAYDDIGANRDPVSALSRMRPAPRTDRLSMKDIMGAAQRLASEVHDGRFRHFGQADLDAAVDNASWRDVAKSGRAFGSKAHDAASINPLVAVSLALWTYDKQRDRQPLSIVAS